jgi:RNA polymerase sigma factor (sigma-70 family)
MATTDNEPSDSALLREFLLERSEAAFRQLTARHIDLVFGTALRRANDRGAAEEIAQNVFLALAKKAPWLQSESTLAGWLHRTALLEAKQWWRSELRRRQREETAAKLETTMKSSDSFATDLAGELDDALLELREGERQAVLLRYFEWKNHREIGATLGIGEDAARKRVDKALDQIAAFFRKRGHAIGGGTAAAALLSGSVEAGPAWLVETVTRSVLAGGAPVGAAWLARLLGASGLQIVVLGVAILGVPAAWQTARLESARGERSRLEAMLNALQGQHRSVDDEMARMRRQVFRASNDLEAASITLRNVTEMASAGSTNIDPTLFLWDESADYVRVPKSVLARIRFDGATDRWGLHVDSAESLDPESGKVSEALLRALGVNPQTQTAVQELFDRHLHAYRDWVETNSYLAEFPKVAELLTNRHAGGMSMAAQLHIDDGTRVWVVPNVPGNGETWRAQFHDELTSLIGGERADVLFGIAKDDGSLSASFHQFGASQAFLVVTPNQEGGFWLSQNLKGSWLYNMPVSFSDVLDPVPGEMPFDEAAVRRETMALIEQAKARLPDKEIPPIEHIIAENLWLASRSEGMRGAVQSELGRSLPVQVLEYLRQWRASHPAALKTTGSSSTSKANRP